MKKPLAIACSGLFHSLRRLWRFRFFEPNPRFELGTPSLRVKCSTAELIRPWENTWVLFGTANIRKKSFPAKFFGQNLAILSYLRVKSDSQMITFLICLALLVGAYFTYGRFLEQIGRAHV